MIVLGRTLCPWLSDSLPALQRLIVRRAFVDIGICETPAGSNRNERIDEYNLAAGSPVGSYWCASAMAAWLRESGAKTVGRPSSVCERWRKWAIENGTFIPRETPPEPGWVILYGKTPLHADHCGIVARTSPGLFSIEGNTSGTAYSRNGELVDFKPLNFPAVIGWINPVAL